MLSFARSGSTVLRGMLSKHPDIAAQGEILTEQQGSFLLYLRDRAAEDPDLCLPSHRMKLFHSYLSELCAALPASRVVMFDVKYGTLHHLAGVWEPTQPPTGLLQEIQTHGWQLVHLVRENHLQRIVSDLRAIKTGQYHSERGRRRTRARVYVEPAQLIRLIRATAQVVEQTREFFTGWPTCMELRYEELFESIGGRSMFSASVRSRLAEFLGVRDLFEARPHLVKLATMRVADSIENYPEVVEALGGTEFAYLLDYEDDRANA